MSCGELFKIGYSRCWQILSSSKLLLSHVRTCDHGVRRPYRLVDCFQPSGSMATVYFPSLFGTVDSRHISTNNMYVDDKPISKGKSEDKKDKDLRQVVLKALPC
ncbi:hypothetical protein BS78_03G405100 [Paspalum vaginatum]|nr:hypothetical protein BS78_03G405100 [Paspalum vaginatum]